MQSLGRNIPLRRDPAPTRWQYRLQRLWLTPYYRVLVRYGGPVIVLAVVAQLVLQSETRRAAIVQSFVDIQQKFQARPEFRVGLLSIEGASADLAERLQDASGGEITIAGLRPDLLDLAHKVLRGAA